MKLRASIRFREAVAIYEIRQEAQGIYTAHLQHYEGSVHNMPATQVVLTQGIRHWIGSTDDRMLIRDLGQVIDDFLARPATVDRQELRSRKKR